MIVFVRFLLGFMLVFTALFLILLVLVQRGKGGGLAGALGGMGGQSAFGAKAGDTFTRITIGVAAFWILLCILSVNVLGRQQSLLSGSLGGSAPIDSSILDDEAATTGGEAASTGEAAPADQAKSAEADGAVEAEGTAPQPSDGSSSE
jgi:preprotein translocase subunit SecG